MKVTAVYSGSFDPITCGHVDIIERASKMYKNIRVVILVNKEKKYMFSTEERTEMIKKTTSHLKNITVESYPGLLVDYCDKNDINVVIRGLRMMSDFEAELQMAHINYFLSGKKVDTVFLSTNTKYSYISSSAVKEIFSFGGNVHGLVPEIVEEFLSKKNIKKA